MAKAITGRSTAVGGPARRGSMGVPRVRGIIAVMAVPRTPRPHVLKAIKHALKVR